MGLIVSKKKYKEALEEIEKLKKEHMKMKKEIVSKDVEINGLNVENESLKKAIKTKNEELFLQCNAMNTLHCNVTYYKFKIKNLEDRIEKLKDNYRDSEIEVLLAIEKRCKKARVKTKYKNKILKVAEKRLAEVER